MLRMRRRLIFVIVYKCTLKKVAELTSNVRIDPETDFKLTALAQIFGLKKTTLVKKAVELYFNQNKPETMEDGFVMKELGNGHQLVRFKLGE